MSKAIKATLAAIGPRQAVVVGKEAPEKLPKGAILLQFGKTYALQREATNVVETLPNKLPAAAKALTESGGVVTAKVAKAAGLDFAALVAKMQGNKAVTVNATASKLIVTPRAKRADLLPLGGEAPSASAPGAKKTPAKVAPKAAPVKANAKAPAAPAPKAKAAALKAKEAPKAAKATKVAGKAAKAAAAPAKAPQKAAAKGKAVPAPAPKAAKAPKGKPAATAKKAPAKEAKPVKAKAPVKGQKDSRPSKG